MASAYRYEGSVDNLSIDKGKPMRFFRFLERSSFITYGSDYLECILTTRSLPAICVDRILATAVTVTIRAHT